MAVAAGPQGNRNLPVTIGMSLFFRLLKRLFSRGAAPGRTVRVTVYSRCDCHLCEIALEQLQKAGHEFALDVTDLDVDADPALKELYGDQVPVISINGKVRFRGRVNGVLLKRVLLAESLRNP
jgi:glutaredoxin